MKQSWDSSNIVFLLLPKQKIQESLLYIGCSAQTPCGKKHYGPGNPVLTSFAKLLLEIDHGRSWPWYISSGSSNSDSVSTWFELCDYVEKLKNEEGGSSYLDAITKTLHLYIALNEIESSQGDGEETDARLRGLIYRDIIRPLKLEAEPGTNKRRKPVADVMSMSGNSEGPRRPVHKLKSQRPSPASLPLRGPGTLYEDQFMDLETESESSIDGMYERERTQPLKGHSERQSQQSPRALAMSPALQHVPQSFSIFHSPRIDSWLDTQPPPEYWIPDKQPPSQTDDDFYVAIICSLPIEADAILCLFDKQYDDRTTRKQPGDTNTYTAGRIGRHNVVICHLPGIGISSAARATSHLLTSYQETRLVLVVGICGATPFDQSSPREEIILGDIVISDRLTQYDFGRQFPSGFQRKKDTEETLGPPNPQIQGLLQKLRIDNRKRAFQEEASALLEAIQQKRGDKYLYPGAESDTLFGSNFVHRCYQQGPTNNRARSNSKSKMELKCRKFGCEWPTIQRKRLTLNPQSYSPGIHIGRFASANTVIKSGKHRDK
ncbi:hypothetical protein TWF481_009125 [Arthrobotrys musiformis]|uniref:Nucleoside phosphorylase domain-containing protein n=1 Tax=Arthrobotrys musiformis TaxID=47236 RepID=A0AAV9W2V3_9PEZI